MLVHWSPVEVEGNGKDHTREFVLLLLRVLNLIKLPAHLLLSLVAGTPLRLFAADYYRRLVDT